MDLSTAIIISLLLVSVALGLSLFWKSEEVNLQSEYVRVQAKELAIYAKLDQENERYRVIAKEYIANLNAILAMQADRLAQCKSKETIVDLAAAEETVARLFAAGEY